MNNYIPPGTDPDDFSDVDGEGVNWNSAEPDDIIDDDPHDGNPPPPPIYY